MQRVVAAAAAAGAVAIIGPTSSGPFPAYLCSPELADAAGAAWAFDLSVIAGTQSTLKSNGYAFDFAGCGISNVSCSMAGGGQWSLAAGVQDEGGGACEVLSAPQAVPLLSLLDPANASAGVAMTFAAARTGSADWGKCAINPATGTETGRTLVVRHACDPSVAPGSVTLLGATEAPECNYVISAASSAACPTRVVAPSPPLPPPSLPPVPVPAGYSAFFPGPSGPFAPYLCTPRLRDSSGATYAYPLGSTYTGTGGWDYNVTTPSNVVYSFQLCGFANTLCVPSGYNTFANFGTAVETLPGQTPPPTQQCSATNGSLVPCTPPCHVLANNAPGWSLLDPTNGAAGIVATYTPAETTATDPFSCPFDPVSYMPTPRQLTVQVKCDSAVPALVFDAVTEPTACSYVAQARSAVACGVKQ